MPRLPWVSESAWAIVEAAKAAALADGAMEITPCHLFQGCARAAPELLRAALAALEAEPALADRLIQAVAGSTSSPPNSQLPVSTSARQVLERARALAAERPEHSPDEASPIHLWVSLCADLPTFAAWITAQMPGWEPYLSRLPDATRQQLPPARPLRSADLPTAVMQTLNQFCSRHLTELARQGKLHKAYGVDNTTQRVVDCLLQRDSRSVILTGPAGVGKTALAEDLAVRIALGEVPELAACEIFELDLTLFTRGTHLAGSRAERWAQLLAALRACPDRIILLIDEIHSIIGLPLEGQAMDLANTMKPLLASGEVRILGTTTSSEYRKHLETDPALARRFAEIKVQEPDRETTLAILRDVAPLYERHHGVRYSPESLEAIFEYAHRWLLNTAFPAKGISLMDQIGVRIRRRAMLAGGGSPVEEPVITRADVEAALHDLYGVSETTAVDLEEMLKQRVVGQDHVAAALAGFVARSVFMGQEQERRGPRGVLMFVGPPGVGKTYMAQALSELIYPGQDSLLILDMTEFGGYDTGDHARWRLIGPPPPYVGWEEGGLLTRHVSEHPCCVIVIDELEKAGPTARNVLLPIFDEGVLRDGRGREVSFRNVFFIITANAASRFWEDRSVFSVGFLPRPPRSQGQVEAEDDLRAELLGEGFAPEFLSRLSAVFCFNHLTEEHLREIAVRWLRDFHDRILLRRLVSIRYSENDLTRWLVARCGPTPDVRALRFHLERDIETAVARWWLEHPAPVCALHLSPGEQEVVLTPDTADLVDRDLFAQVHAIFGRSGEQEEALRAARNLLTSGG